MTLAVDITTEDVFTRLRALLVDVLPVGVEVVQGLGNRVPMPAGEFVAMTARQLVALRTPVDTWAKDDPLADELSIEQGLQFRAQLDCYGPRSGDWAAILVAVLRNDYGVQVLGPTVKPLYADDPIQAALIDGEEQYLQRWIVGANLQYNPTVTAPQEFANAAEANLINVDVSYPP